MIDLFCIGNPLVDVFAEVPGSFCARFGLNAPVQHVSPRRAAAILRELEEGRAAGTPPPVRRAGGGAATAARIAAGLGLRTAFAGALGGTSEGPDPPGRFFEAELGRASTALHLVCRTAPTGLCITLKTGSARRIAAAPGAALEFTAEDIPKEPARRARLLLLDGYMLDRKELVQRFFALARTAALDAGSVFMVRAGAGDIAAYIKRKPLLLFMNEAEGAALHRALGENPGPGVPEKETENFLRDLCRGAPRSCVVLKRGSRGALVFKGNTLLRAETEVLHPEHSAGAGDAFAGGFLAGFLQRRTLEECAALGNRTAGAFLAGLPENRP
ncbi:MAG: PfkB family carbohydrate kinase [Spirochaetaceae bacterium]|jgi:fructokinase|nr:PfkB family carbohydrate kinase [Spirochaetaceae bacterium]